MKPRASGQPSARALFGPQLPAAYHKHKVAADSTDMIGGDLGVLFDTLPSSAANTASN